MSRNSSSAGRSGIVFNLKPAKLMGIESNGMVLAASPEGGKPSSSASTARFPPGSRIVDAASTAGSTTSEWGLGPARCRVSGEA